MTDELMDPKKLSYDIAVETSENPDYVGEFVTSIELDDNVTDFRFECKKPGYEGWQWSITLYHDIEAERWTVNESTLAPTENSLLPPKWIPWKDRLKPSDLSVMDSIGTEEDDSRLEDGFRAVNSLHKTNTDSPCDSDDVENEESSEKIDKENSTEETCETESEYKSEYKSETESDIKLSESDNTLDANETDNTAEGSKDILAETAKNSKDSEEDEDLEEVISKLRLSRKHVMTAKAISQTAKRWYAGQHGPKSLSTKVADGNACSSCGFLIPLAGSLGSMFGVCANMWSPDDGRVVSLDHGCGEHSEIEPPEPSQLWIQSAPAYDDYHIDILEQAPREERADVELIEEAIEDSKENRLIRRRTTNSAQKEN